MKKSELKKMLAPIVKECIEECIHEALFDSGIVTNVVAEVMRGINIPQLVESVAPRAARSVPQPVELSEVVAPAKMSSVVNGGNSANAILQKKRLEHRSELNATRSKLEEQFSKSLGVNIFEGTTPVPADSGGGAQSPLGDVDPSDPGVDLTNIPGLTTLNFKNHIKE